MTAPLFSIVVPTLNQAQYIGETLASIAAQRWPRLEVLVMDGGSTDGTRAVVEQYGDLVSHFVSERDGGQADAINKGFRLAKGDVLAWLNSDDLYLPGVFAKIAAQLPDATQPKLAHGGVIAFWQGQPRAQCWLPPADTGERLKTTAAIYQPAAFWTRAMWERAGELNPEYRFVLDWDFFARASAQGEFVALNEALALYRFHAGHKSSSGESRRTQEILLMVERLATPEWAAAFRDVAAELPGLAHSLEHLRRSGLYWLRKIKHPRLYARHGGAKIKRALSQLHV